MRVTARRAALAAAAIARITYPDGTVAGIRLSDPVVGTPEAQWRKGSMTLSWSDNPGDGTTLDQNESTTASFSGHTITLTRGSDDSDNRNWTVSLDG